jgi:hypothetical protein
MGPTEGNKNTVGSCNKSPKEENNNKSRQGTGIGGLFGLVHVQSLF